MAPYRAPPTVPLAASQRRRVFRLDEPRPGIVLLWVSAPLLGLGSYILQWAARMDRLAWGSEETLHLLLVGGVGVVLAGWGTLLLALPRRTLVVSPADRTLTLRVWGRARARAPLGPSFQITVRPLPVRRLGRDARPRRAYQYLLVCEALGPSARRRFVRAAEAHRFALALGGAAEATLVSLDGRARAGEDLALPYGQRLAGVSLPEVTTPTTLQVARGAGRVEIRGDLPGVSLCVDRDGVSYRTDLAGRSDHVLERRLPIAQIDQIVPTANGTPLVFVGSAGLDLEVSPAFCSPGDDPRLFREVHQALVEASH